MKDGQFATFRPVLLQYILIVRRSGRKRSRCNCPILEQSLDRFQCQLSICIATVEKAENAKLNFLICRFRFVSDTRRRGSALLLFKFRTGFQMKIGLEDWIFFEEQDVVGIVVVLR